MRLKEQKPLVVVVDGVAASGGYITAIAADHIIAMETSLIGSIGVLFQYPNVADLLKTLGIKVEEIKSSPLKAAPNGFEPTSPEARAAIEAIVSDSYAWFRGIVKARRHLDDAGLERVADGRVFTGRQGVALKLIDEIGDERAALAWLAKEKNIDPKTPVRDYRSALAANTTAYGTFFRGMLKRGVYPPPSQFEAWFLSSAHTDAHIRKTILAARGAMKDVARLD